MQKFFLSVSSSFEKNIITVDDIIDFIKKSNNDLAFLMVTFSLILNITEKTRITYSSASSIDNILSNLSGNMYGTGIVEPCLSDHYAQYITVAISVPKAEKNFILKRFINVYSLKAIRKYLDRTHQDHILSSNNI